MTHPIILIDPQPRSLDLICDAQTRKTFEGLVRITAHENGPMPDEMVEQYLLEATILIVQTAWTQRG